MTWSRTFAEFRGHEARVPRATSTLFLALRRLALCLLGFAFSAAAQNNFENMLFTAGTVKRDAASRDWAYLLWQPTAPALVQGKSFAIYAKPGNAGSVSPYARKAVVTLHTDPVVIAPLLNRAVNLGDDLSGLDSAMSSLFQDILPPGLLTPAEKLSAVIRGSSGNAERENSLQLLARLHPGVAMSLGTAHAELIGPGESTFEVREFDPANNTDLGVVGRVTVEANNPVVIPAPDRPVQVPEVDDKTNPKTNSAKGHLNIKLRWATTADLRRLSILTHGFNVYQITRSYAEANNYHITPPSTATLLVLATSNTNVHRVNQAPVLKTRDFDPGTGAGQVGDFGTNVLSDRTSYFVADDHDRFLPGGQPFEDGAEYYYFVTARDVLGRDGLVSLGVYVKICRRMSPLPPQGLSVVNDYVYESGAGRQALKLIWPQNVSTADDPTAGYWVYRWTSISNMQASEADPSANLIAIVPHVGGQELQTNLDFGLGGSPTLPADAGRTYWYSVRAGDSSVCGTNLSGNSAPAYGVLRDREGPGAATGQLAFDCVKPSARFVGIASELPSGQLDNTRFYFRVECQRTSFEIAWAEFYAVLNDGSHYIGRKSFFGTDPAVSFSVDYPQFISESARFLCRVASKDGQVSSYADSGQVLHPTGNIRLVRFAGDLTVTHAQIGNGPGTNDCNRHTPVPPGSSTVMGPCVTNVTLHPKTKAWKVYRRLDDGPLTLVKAGTNDASLTFSYCDDAMPPNTANLCYYVQAFDQDGNASPMAIIGCVQVTGTVPLPTPLLSTIRQGSNDTMQLSWFCQPHGVERFEVGIAPKKAATSLSLPLVISSQLSSNASVTTMNLVVKGETNSYAVDFRRSPKVGPLFGNGGAQFLATVNIEKDVEYTVFVRAIGPGNTPGPDSNIQQFKWSPARVDQPEVPWPARDLPPVTPATSFHPDITAVQLNTVFDGLAVRIGRAPIESTQWQHGQPINVFGITQDPMTWVYTNAAGKSLGPIALYRYQVPSTEYPNVSGDITQVSPLMERIAYFVNSGNLQIYDPFIRLENVPLQPQQRPYLYLIDTQPVVIGARYKYLLVRFKPDREIDQVIATTDVEVLP